MVTSVFSLGRNGLYDWLVQRISAVVMLVWFVFTGVFIATHSPVTFDAWHGLFAHTAMRVFTLLAMLSLCVHAWVGMWTIATDYFTPAMLGTRATTVRLLFQLTVLAVLLGYFIWCIQILWSS